MGLLSDYKKSSTEMGKLFNLEAKLWSMYGEEPTFEIYENEFGVIVAWVDAKCMMANDPQKLSQSLRDAYGLRAVSWSEDPWSYRYYAVCEWA